MKIFSVSFSRAAALKLVFAICLCCVAVIAGRLQPSKEDISIMLPGGRGEVAHDMRLLQNSPWADKVLVFIQAPAGSTPEKLENTASRLAENLPDKFFSHLKDQAEFDLPRITHYFLARLPLLAGRQMVGELSSNFSCSQVQKQIAENYVQLTGPRGFGLKQAIMLDPLNLRRFFLKRLLPFRSFMSFNSGQGFILSKDKRSALIIASSRFKSSYSVHSEAMLRRLHELRLKLVPENFTFQVISAHVYATANARMIRSDMQIILLFSLAGLGLIFMVFIRSTKGLWILSVPLLSLLWALACYLLAYSQVSVIVLGFGAVLLGLTLDFGIHTYLGLGSNLTLSLLTRPLFLSGLTTCLGFAALYFSSIPGISQLALLSISGIIFACLFSLFVLPPLVGKIEDRVAKNKTIANRSFLFRSTCVFSKNRLILWLLALLVLGFGCLNLHFSGSLRDVGYFPPKTMQAEKQVKQIWGKLKKDSMLVVQGRSLQDSLEINDKIYEYFIISRQAAFLSLSSFLPSIQSQRLNLQAWRDFWSLEKISKFKSWAQAAGKKFGFSSLAFSSFEKTIESDYTPDFITLASLDQLGLSVLSGLFIGGEQNNIYSYLESGLSPKFSKFIAAMPEACLVSASGMGMAMEEGIKKDLVYYAGIGLGLMGLFLLAVFKNMSDMLKVFGSPMTGVLTVLGLSGLNSTSLNLFQVAAVPLIIGLGVDYGIFMLYWTREKTSVAIPMGVLISALSTILAFGALGLANHPALHSLGLTVALGVLGAAIYALFVLPSTFLKK